MWGTSPAYDVELLYTKRPQESRKAYCDLLSALSSRHSGEAFLQVGDNIVDMLGADGQSDGVRAYALVQQFLEGELGVGGGGRVDDQGLHVRHVSQQ